ncbi:MAG: DUF1571 domain-containing protein, partial [Candidatus Omnitrophica bacterium]|nr:DUF1571 domain-containing protein [Candidatus Omnitrophota bacterium]
MRSKTAFLVFLWAFSLGGFSGPAHAVGTRELASGLVLLKGESPQGPEPARLAGLLDKALDSYESMRDYRAVFYKREKSGSGLGETEKIFLKFEKPFKVFMKWLNTDKKGLQVVYGRGENRGRLAVHKPGLGVGLLPVIYLDPGSPWIRKGSASYNIEDVGIGTFLFDFTKAVLRGFREEKLHIVSHGTVREGTFLGEKVEVTFVNTEKSAFYFAYRIITLFDSETGLPVKFELFDWKNELIGVYVYENLKLNTGLDDPAFKKEISQHLHRVFRKSSPHYPSRHTVLSGPRSASLARHACLPAGR